MRNYLFQSQMSSSSLLYTIAVSLPFLRRLEAKTRNYPSKEALSDKSSDIRSCKDPVLADRLIRNTYKTLMSRGQKGCFIYCEDKPLLEYISQEIGIPIKQ